MEGFPFPESDCRSKISKLLGREFNPPPMRGYSAEYEKKRTVALDFLKKPPSPEEVEDVLRRHGFKADAVNLSSRSYSFHAKVLLTMEAFERTNPPEEVLSACKRRISRAYYSRPYGSSKVKEKTFCLFVGEVPRCFSMFNWFASGGGRERLTFCEEDADYDICELYAERAVVTEYPGYSVFITLAASLGLTDAHDLSVWSDQNCTQAIFSPIVGEEMCSTVNPDGNSNSSMTIACDSADSWELTVWPDQDSCTSQNLSVSGTSGSCSGFDGNVFFSVECKHGMFTSSPTIRPLTGSPTPMPSPSYQFNESNWTEVNWGNVTAILENVTASPNHTNGIVCCSGLCRTVTGPPWVFNCSTPIVEGEVLGKNTSFFFIWAVVVSGLFVLALLVACIAKIRKTAGSRVGILDGGRKGTRWKPSDDLTL